MDISEVFQIYRPLFKECIKPTTLLPYLLKQQSFRNVKAECFEITKAQAEDPIQAAEILLTLIEVNEDHEKFITLITALKEAEYEDLAENLEGIPDIKEKAILKSWMAQHFETLQTVCVSESLLCHLKSKDVIRRRDEKDISKIEKRFGPMRGVFFLFALVVKSKAGWHKHFVDALRASGQERQAHILETGNSQGFEEHSPKSLKQSSSPESAVSRTAVACQEDHEVPSVRLPPVGEEEKESTAYHGPSTQDSGTPTPPLTTGMSVAGSGQDIAMDSDEEIEMLNKAIEKSMSHSVNMETDMTKQAFLTSTSIDDSMSPDRTNDEDTSPKQRLANRSNPLTTTIMNEQGAVPKTSIPKRHNGKLDNHGSESDSLSMDEMRRKRLAMFDKGRTSSEQRDHIPEKARYQPVKEDKAEVSQFKYTSNQETLFQSLDLTLNSSISGTSATGPSPQEESDFDMASRLQQEEYSLSGITTDDNVTLTPELNNLGGASGRSRNIPAINKNINEKETNKETATQELKLRKYQEELARPAKDGTNTVIVAPTGSGKTIVALDIIKDHFDNADVAEDPKVGFIVPTIPLVEQQKNQFKKFTALTDKRIIAISGDSNLKKRVSFAMQLGDCDIAVFTPQLLIDSIRKKEVKSLNQFTLLIFDECHHSMKDHPYNVIMSTYFEEKKLRRQTHLPQIVGLTASVGVGKADSNAKTEDHIIMLCACLDAEIVTVNENVEELKKHVNNPIEIIEEVRSRTDDPFKEKVTEMMRKIEARMTTGGARVTWNNPADFRKVMKPPNARDTDFYTQWISSMDQFVTEIEDQAIQRVFVECIKYLKVYNKALLVNADCRAKDALEQIKKEMERITFPHVKEETIEKKLWTMFQEQKELLEKDVRYMMDDSKNPKLKKLKDILIQEYNENQDLRGIIFCKTRDLTVALQNWINEDAQIKHLNPHQLVGTHTPQSSGGMTLPNIEDVLKYFRDGHHKIIVATTVAEEGLDIQKCNLVIRYEHVTNEIARTQAKGRGRAQNAKYILIGETGRGAIEKDRINKMREQMMKIALKNIVLLIRKDQREYWARIKEQQQKLAIDREMKNLGKSQKQVLNKNNRLQDFDLRCLKCSQYACMGSDIRKIEGAHHVVIDPDFEDNLKLHIFPEPATYKHLTQKAKLFCKKCSHPWGTQGEYKNVVFSIVNVNGFMFVDSNRRKGKFRKWKDVPFQVPNLSLTELKALHPKVTERDAFELGEVLELQ